MKKDFVPMDKRSKKERKAYNDSKRVTASFNTGTRIHKDSRHPSRAQLNSRLQKTDE